MAILYISIFLLLYSIFTNNEENNFDRFVIAGVFLFLVVSKVFVNIWSLPDLDQYYWGYKELSNVDWKNIANHDLAALKCPEIGFRYILKIGSWLGDFKWSLLIIAIVNTFAYVSLAKKYSPYIMVSLIIFLLGSVQSFFVLRQHLAIAITIFSYAYIINRDWKKFCLLMILAFSFHQTALVFIPVYFIYGIKSTRILNIVLVVLFAFLIITFTQLLNNFATSLQGYDGYIDSNESNITALLISACYLFTYIFFLRENVYTQGFERLVFILLAINFMMLLSGYTFTGINRLLMYYSVANILTVPITMIYIERSPIRYAYCAFVLLLLTYMFYNGSNAEYIKMI